MSQNNSENIQVVFISDYIVSGFAVGAVLYFTFVGDHYHHICEVVVMLEGMPSRPCPGQDDWRVASCLVDRSERWQKQRLRSEELASSPPAPVHLCRWKPLPGSQDSAVWLQVHQELVTVVSSKLESDR